MRPLLPSPTPTPWSSLLSPMTISFWRIYFGDCLPLRYLAKWILHPGFWPPPNAFQIPKSQLHFFINHPFQRAGKFLGFLLITARMVSYCCCQACNQLVSSLCGDRHISSSWVKHLPQRRLQTLHTLLPGLPLLLGGRSSTVRPDPLPPTQAAWALCHWWVRLWREPSALWLSCRAAFLYLSFNLSRCHLSSKTPLWAMGSHAQAANRDLSALQRRPLLSYRRCWAMGWQLWTPNSLGRPFNLGKCTQCQDFKRKLPLNMQFLILAGELEHEIWGFTTPPSWPPVCDRKHILVILVGPSYSEMVCSLHRIQVYFKISDKSHRD